MGMAQAVVIGIMLLQGMHIGKPVDGGAVLAGCYEFPADTACRGWVGDGQEFDSALDLVDGMILPTVFYLFFVLALSPCLQGGDGFFAAAGFPEYWWLSWAARSSRLCSLDAADGG